MTRPLFSIHVPLDADEDAITLDPAVDFYRVRARTALGGIVHDWADRGELAPILFAEWRAGDR